MHFFVGYNQLTYTGFDEEDNDDELRMLNINDRRPLSLALWPQCVVDEDSSLYIGCDGSEVPFSSSLFTIQKTNKDIPFVIEVIKNNYHQTKISSFCISIQ